MVLPVIILGFVMLTLGFAMLCFGEVPFLGGKRIPASRSRAVGGVLVSFLPVMGGLRAVVTWTVGVNLLVGAIVAWLLLVVYLLIAFAMLYRILVPRREARSSGDYDVIEIVEEPTHTTQKPSKAVEDDNPFHFS
jgi:hypothetical protein